ncbi:MAG: glycosyltransferase family 2 protein [Candidatus Rokubacteria bacterium]|nr:glycosyltransferase family 2 protein [Candidatus Rokubacteria bacterium]MBI3824840.1 glycosyltransferase family 2 protein [Candidatus Rokubacteria bacterium]
MSPADGLSVVLPVLNERESLEPLHERITAALEPLDREYEVLYVDDGSTDGSWEVLRRLAAADGRVRLVRLRRNFGQTAALAAGLAHSRHPILITLDADLQNDPGDIPRLVAKLEQGYDVVSGWRRVRHDRWLTRTLPSRIANFLIRKVSGVELHDFGCTLKACRREVAGDVSLLGDMHRFVPVLAAWVGARIAELEVTHHDRAHGTSKYGLLRTYKVLIDLVTLKFIGDFSTRPNYVFGTFGLLSLGLGLASLVVVAYRLFVLRRLEATPLVFFMVVFFLTGVFSLFIGLLAEIVIRGFHETQRKPTYYVRETVGVAAAADDVRDRR